MKKNKYTYYLQNIVITLLFITVLSSCQFEELAEGCDEKGVIMLNLGLDGMSTRAAGDTEETISTVRIFVFAGDVLEVNRLFTKEETNFTNPIRLEVLIGDKEIYVVANESVALAAKLNNVNTKNDLFSITADDITSQLTLPLVMTGSASATVIGITEEIIYLTRVAAKISLQLMKSSVNEADAVEITKVSFISNTSKSTLFPIPPATALTLLYPADYWNHVYALPETLTLTTTSQAIGNFYVYENLGNSHTNKGVATQLELEAIYNNIDTKYRVYINEDITSPGTGNPGDPNSSIVDVNDHYYNIWRNYHYQLTGTISGVGEYTSISVEVKILPWTVHEYAVPLE
jgi:hypothetical protein